LLHLALKASKREKEEETIFSHNFVLITECIMKASM
jgi:hypothetical protein